MYVMSDVSIDSSCLKRQVQNYLLCDEWELNCIQSLSYQQWYSAIESPHKSLLIHCEKVVFIAECYAALKGIISGCHRLKCR